MKANELRIGNFVLGASRGGFLTVSGDLIEQIERGIVVVGPILLTEEWFKRFGFEGTEFLLGKGNFTYQIQNKTLAWFGIMIHPSLWDEVHKFQNLYFALTGQELKLTDK